MLVKMETGGSGSGGQSKSGTFTVAAGTWGTADLGFTPTKVYLGFTTTNNYGAGYAVYDEELGRYKFIYQASSFYDLPLTNNFEITSSPKGFKIKNPWGSYGIVVYYLAEG